MEMCIVCIRSRYRLFLRASRVVDKPQPAIISRTVQNVELFFSGFILPTIAVWRDVTLELKWMAEQSMVLEIHFYGVASRNVLSRNLRGP